MPAEHIPPEAPAAAAPPATTAGRLAQAAQLAAITACLPRLESLLAPMARGVAAQLTALINQPCTVEAQPAVAETYAAFVARQPTTAHMDLMGVPGAPTAAVLLCNSQLLSLLIELLFGGTGRYANTRTQDGWTPTEQRVIERFSAILREEFVTAWGAVATLPSTPLRHVRHPSLLHLAAPDEGVATLRLAVTLGAGEAAVIVCLPSAFLQPLRDPFSGLGHGTTGPDPHPWRALLTRHLAGLDVELTYTLGTATLSLREVLDLRRGDIIPLEPPPRPGVCVEGLPLFPCRHGARHGRYAVRLEPLATARSVPPPAPPSPPAAPAAEPRTA